MYHACHSFQRTNRGSSRPMLPGSRFGNNSFFAESLREQHLADGIINFVCTSAGWQSTMAMTSRQSLSNLLKRCLETSFIDQAKIFRS
jgi:hypothetical protein